MRRAASLRVRSIALWLAVLVPLLVVTSLPHGSDRFSPVQTVFRLPRYTMPGHVALARDGSVWMTQEYGGLTRLSPTGRTEDFLTSDDFVFDIVQGSDGSMWAADFLNLVRIAGNGEVTMWPVKGYGHADAITIAGGAIWFVNGGNVGGGYRPRINRATTDGVMRGFIDPVTSSWLGFNSVAAAPDGSLWFTESGEDHASIGRMTPDGRYSNWPLPRRAGEAGRITAGPDGALWFIVSHAIGRISTSGRIHRFALPAAIDPHDITAGRDGALWFTSDTCAGRITTSGQITTWRVPGAKQLQGIAAAADGTFWFADRIGNVIRHFTPWAVPDGSCGAPTFTRRAYATSATVAYQRTDRFDGVDYFVDIRMRISRDGTRLFSELVPGLGGYGAHSDTGSLTVRDLDGDGEPEVMLLLNWNGAHCCSWSRVYHYDAVRHSYVAENHFWGNGGAEPQVVDLNGDARPELVSLDDRFDGVFSNFAGSLRPIQIWSYDHGAFRDVTRDYPMLIRKDAANIWRLYLKYRPNDARGILPAWVADEYVLGRAGVADRALEQARLRGDLKSVGYDGPRDPRAYVRALTALLRRTGYVR